MTIETENDEIPGVEERYTAANNASNLRVQAEKRGPADVIIAVGMSRNRTGAALMRLHSEWDGVEKPLKPTKLSIDRLAASLKRQDERDRIQAQRRRERPAELSPAQERARTMAYDWYHHELGLLFARLPSLPAVRANLNAWAAAKRMEGAVDKVADVLRWWLHGTCATCQGVKYELIPGTNRQSARVCPVCKASGEQPLPHGQEGRALLAEMNMCLNSVRASMGYRLQRMRAPSDNSDTENGPER